MKFNKLGHVRVPSAVLEIMKVYTPPLKINCKPASHLELPFYYHNLIINSLFMIVGNYKAIWSHVFYWSTFLQEVFISCTKLTTVIIAVTVIAMHTLRCSHRSAGKVTCG